MEKADLSRLPSELLYHIFDYCDIQTILLSLRCVCKHIHDVIMNYNAFEFTYCLSSELNFKVLSRLIQPENIVSLIIVNSRDNALYSFITIFDIGQFTRLRSLALYGIDYEIVENFLQGISSNLLAELSILANRTKIWNPISSTVARFKLQKLVLNNSDLNIKATILWPTDWELKYLAIGTCSLSQYLAIIDQLRHLRKFTMEDCVIDYYSDVTNIPSSDQTHTPSLVYLTITNCSVDLEQLESLLSLTPKLTHLEIIFNWKLYDHPLDGCHLERIIKTKLPALRRFKFFFPYNHYFSSCDSFISIQSLIAPFRTPFWLEEKRLFVNCDHIFQTRRIRLYTIPVEIRHESRIWWTQDFTGKLGLLNFNVSEILTSYSPDCGRRSFFENDSIGVFGRRSQFYIDHLMALSLHETNNVIDRIGCEISSIDYIPCLTRKSLDKTTDDFEKEVCAQNLSCEEIMLSLLPK